MGWAAEDDYEATYGKEQAKIRRRLKNQLMGEATMGTKAGQWSARKSQELKRRYEAACERKEIKPYKGSKTAKQKDLGDWSDQKWRTDSGGKSSVTGEPYFPTKAVKALKDKELYAKAKRQKAAATRAGKQRATYSKDIQAVVARYRAEDHTIDDLDDQSIMIRMEDLAERMDAIVQRIGSYPDAERDPEYLRLVQQHTAYARVLARRHGFGAEDEDLQVCYNCKTTREERSVLPHRLSRGETKTTRKLGLCYDCGGCYDCCELVCEPDDVKADHGFEAESDASFTPDPDLPLNEQARDQYMFMMPDGSALWIHNQDWSVGIADMKPTWDSKRLSDYGDTPTTVTYMSLGAVDPADYTDFIPEWRSGMSFPPEDMVDQWIDPNRLGQAHNEFTKQYETSFWPGLSLREILGKYDGGKPVFDAEEFEYPHHDPDWLYEHHIVQGLSARKIAEMLDVPVNLITRRLHEFGLYVPGEYTADRRMTENELRRMRERRAEDDPTSTAVYIGPGNHLSVVDFIDSDHFVLIDSQPRTEYQGGEHEMEPWMQHYFMDQLMDMAKALDYELEDNQTRLNDQNASRMTFRTPSGQTIDYYYNCVYPFAEGQEIPEVMESLSTADRLIIAGYHPVEQLLDDMPNLDQVYLYVNTHYPTEEGDHFDDFGKPTVIKGFFERDNLRFTIMDMDEDYESGNITDQYMEQGSIGEYDGYPEAAQQIESNYWLEAEEDPVSRIAAGTNDALADFANANDTDDGFYFVGGLIGGLFIAVAGNIISDRLQDWWRSRSA